MQDPDLGRPRLQFSGDEHKYGFSEKDIDDMEKAYIDHERQANLEGVQTESLGTPASDGKPAEKQSKLSLNERDRQHGRVVDVVLSDMCEPWDQTTGFQKRSISDPYHRMANTSGIAFKDHANSMVRSFPCQGSGPRCVCAWVT